MNYSPLSQTQIMTEEADLTSQDVAPRRVAVDATCWQNNRGYGRHARNLLTALAQLDVENRYTFFVDAEETLESIPSNVESVLVRATEPTAEAASSEGRRSFADMMRMSKALSQPGFDLVLFPTVYSYVPVFSRAHKMVFIHDVIAEKYPDLTLPSFSARLAWNLKVRAALYQAGTIVTVSEYSKLGIMEVFNVAAEKVKVVGEAPGSVFKKLKEPRPASLLKWAREHARAIVYVGGFGPHKNLSRLLEAFAQLAARDEFKDVSLVMVGKYQSEVFHSEYDELQRKIAALGIEKRVAFTGYLLDDALVVLLNHAQALVLPSLMEGYGLPAVEAAACGCPVIATSASPLPSLLGDGAMYFDPLNSDELRDALARTLTSESLRRAMSLAGMKAAGKLTWERAALDLKELIGAVCPQ